MKLLKFSEVAERLNCSLSNVYNLADAGVLPVHHVGLKKGKRVSEADLLRDAVEQAVDRECRPRIAIGVAEERTGWMLTGEPFADRLDVCRQEDDAGFLLPLALVFREHPPIASEVPGLDPDDLLRSA